MVDKKELRLKIKNNLKNIPRELFQEKGEKLSSNLKLFLSSLNIQKENIVFGVFAPMKIEANYLPALNGFENSLAFPSFIAGSKNEMEFLKSTFDELTDTKDFGVTIKVPPKSAEVVIPNIMIVPALAFNIKGERLGRGGGFYDKYLKSFEGLKVGIAIDDQIVQEIPVDKHDIKVDILITNKDTYIVDKNAVAKWQQNIKRNI